MNLLSTLRNCLELPAYWRESKAARTRLRGKIRKEAYGPHSRQYALVVDPPAGTTRPGHYAFYFHGGAWTFGRPETFAAAASPWLRAGFRVVLPSYRRPPGVGLDRIVADCRRAVGHFVPPAGALTVHLGGMSAGAHLAAVLASDRNLWQTVNRGRSPAAVLACAGPLSFADLHFRRLFLPRYAHLDALSVLPQAADYAPRWLLVHGTADTTVDIAHSRNFFARLVELGYRAELTEIPGGSHIDAGRWLFGEGPAEEVEAFIGRGAVGGVSCSLRSQ